MTSISAKQPGRGADDQSAFSSGNGATSQDMESVARALGWLSLGVGVSSLLAPHEMARLIGIDGGSPAMLRVVGLREIVNGVGILTQANPTPWLWARVGGDAMDLALLRSALDSPTADRNRVTAATAAVLGMTAVDAFCGLRSSAAPAEAPPPSRPVEAIAAVTIHAPVDQVYARWEGFQHLPRFMNDFASVEIVDDRHSHWRLVGPGGMTLEWDVAITDAAPNERIAWRAAGAADLAVDGEVRFRPAPRDQGTEVIFDARMQPPGGEIGKSIAGFFAKAFSAKIGADLRRSKQLIELGEIVQSDDSITPGLNPAQPPEHAPSL
jgi:uncharacterized membrane protein